MLKSRSPYLLYAPAIGWGVLILYFSLLPGPKVPDLLKSIEDSILHFSIYFIFSLLIGLGSNGFKALRPANRALISAIGISVLLGAIIELVQEHYILNRTGGWDDILANSMGGVLGVFLLVLLKRG